MNQQALWRHRANRVINFTHERFDQDIDLDALAEVACLSKFHFARTFSKECLQSPLRYLWQLRLERAARQLALDPRRHVTDIALACGFASPQTFSQTFKAEFGASPIEFRRERNKFKSQNLKEIEAAAPPLSTVTVEARPALKLAYIRSFGPLASVDVSAAYQHLKAWAWRNEIDPDKTPLIGVCPDNPRFAKRDRYIYDAAIPVPSHVTEDDTVSIRTIPKGIYAVALVEAPYHQHLALWEWLITLWLSEVGENYVQKWSYERFMPTPTRSRLSISQTELCLRLEDR